MENNNITTINGDTGNNEGTGMPIQQNQQPKETFGVKMKKFRDKVRSTKAGRTAVRVTKGLALGGFGLLCYKAGQRHPEIVQDDEEPEVVITSGESEREIPNPETEPADENDEATVA